MRAVAVALLLCGCATAKDRARAIDRYVEAHGGLTRDEVDRMRHREARIGDALERVKLAWQGASFDLAQEQPPLTTFSVRLPIGTEPAYLESADGKQQTQVVEDGSVVLTFENGKLSRWQIISLGNLHTGM